ncbi:MAG: hypothetical protein ACON35_07375 [Candidatus Marinamargulisbacteria bacterium]
MEWSLPREQMQRDYRLIKEGMAVQFHNFKAHLNAVLHISNPSYKRYKFVAYKDEDDNIIPIQFIDWARVPPTISHRPLDMYVTGKYTFFCLEPQNGVPLYTHDGRFYKDPDGLLRSVAHHLPVLGQKGRIYLSTSEPDVDQYGVIYEDDIEVDQFKIQKFASSKGLWTIEGTVFYMRDPDIVEFSDAPYEILQGYFEEGNEPPGMMTSPTIVPFGEGMAKSAKSYMDTYELLFKAIDD